jgi:hypothetical protein
MQSYKIGEKIIYYINTNDFLYKVVKEFYFSDIKLFDSVKVKNEEDKKNAIHVELIKNGYKCYVKTGDASIVEWKHIIDTLKEKYKKDEKIIDEVVAEINKKEADEKELLLEFRKKVRAINPQTNLGKVLSYAPINEYGYSEKVFFETFNESDHNLVPNNGIKWKRQVERYLKIKTFTHKNKTVAFQFVGFNLEYGHKNRYIRADIKKIITQQRCAHCNVKSNIEVDHKNGRYDDKKALNSITQNLSDFQPLCHKCNKLKRSSCVKCKENMIRYDATFLGYNVSTTKGDLEYCKSINCNGCYWYDPIDFKSRLILKID